LARVFGNLLQFALQRGKAREVTDDGANAGQQRVGNDPVVTHVPGETDWLLLFETAVWRTGDQEVPLSVDLERRAAETFLPLLGEPLVETADDVGRPRAEVCQPDRRLSDKKELLDPVRRKLVPGALEPLVKTCTTAGDGLPGEVPKADECALVLSLGDEFADLFHCLPSSCPCATCQPDHPVNEGSPCQEPSS
jgi:hypothetical protein